VLCNPPMLTRARRDGQLDSGPEAEAKRIAPDGCSYTHFEFTSHFGGQLGDEFWNSAREEGEAQLDPDSWHWTNDDLPIYQAETEQIDRYIRECHTVRCAAFSAGHCQYHKPMQCFDYHFEGQKRRPPIGPDGRLRYWDIQCESLKVGRNGTCHRGDDCRLAHSKDEISYHPAKYKTRACNGTDCRQDICCFAHQHEGEVLRSFAPLYYSQAPAVMPAASVDEQQGQQLSFCDGELKDDTATADKFDLLTFKVAPCKQGRAHDRKLCMFWHNVRDKRRPPGSYEAEPCSECFDFDTPPKTCAQGDSCNRCHNRLELLYHPDVFKKRFCATFPNVLSCQRGSYCAFAHSREEMCAELFTEEEERSAAQVGSPAANSFYMYRFKTLWCPYGVQHDWHTCLYSHTYQDWRRSPKFGYGSEPCPDWEKNNTRPDYKDRCPRGFCCHYAHGSKEQLYHPAYYKTNGCTDLKAGRSCPRGVLCAFWHSTDEFRKLGKAPKGDYRAPMADLARLRELQPGFSRPPLFGMDDEPFGRGDEQTSFHTTGDNRVVTVDVFAALTSDRTSQSQMPPTKPRDQKKSRPRARHRRERQDSQTHEPTPTGEELSSSSTTFSTSVAAEFTTPRRSASSSMSSSSPTTAGFAGGPGSSSNGTSHASVFSASTMSPAMPISPISLPRRNLMSSGCLDRFHSLFNELPFGDGERYRDTDTYAEQTDATSPFIGANEAEKVNALSWKQGPAYISCPGLGSTECPGMQDGVAIVFRKPGWQISPTFNDT